MQGQIAGDYPQQIEHCEHALATVEQASDSVHIGLQRLMQALTYTLQLDLTECYIHMVSHILLACNCITGSACILQKLPLNLVSKTKR